MNAQVSVSDQIEGRRKGFLEWTRIDLCGGNVVYYKGVHHPVPILYVAGLGKTLANQSTLF